MLTYDTAIEVAHSSSKKKEEPVGVFEWKEISTTARHETWAARFFTRRLDGVPPSGAKLVAQVWPDGRVVKGEGK